MWSLQGTDYPCEYTKILAEWNVQTYICSYFKHIEGSKRVLNLFFLVPLSQISSLRFLLIEKSVLIKMLFTTIHFIGIDNKIKNQEQMWGKQIS